MWKNADVYNKYEKKPQEAVKENLAEFRPQSSCFRQRHASEDETMDL